MGSKEIDNSKNYDKEIEVRPEINKTHTFTQYTALARNTAISTPSSDRLQRKETNLTTTQTAQTNVTIGKKRRNL